MPTKPVFKRRTFLVKKGMQFRYIGIVFALALIVSIVTGYTVFATIWSFLGEKLSSVYPQGRVVYMYKVVNMTLMRNFFLLSPFIFILTLLFSHRIAGPIYRIEKSLGEVAKGNLALKIRLRKGDELQDLAAVINSTIENLKQSTLLNKEIAAKIQEDLHDITAAISAEPYDHTEIRSSMNDLQAKIKELNSFLSIWTTS